MKRSDSALLLVLAALWGSSYLFMRLGAGEFGAVPLAAVRAAGATLILAPLLFWRGGWAELRAHWKGIALVGISGNALPYVLFSFAALSIGAGVSSVLTATTPLFAAVVARLWLGETLHRSRVFGLIAGFGGVLWLVSAKTGFDGEEGAAGRAMAACLIATLLYAFSANLAKRRLGGVSPLAVAAGSQLASAALLALPAALLWPDAPPAPRAWGAAVALAVVCTAVAYVLFFRLISRVGASRTVTVTFLIPVFGVVWGVLFLGEILTREMMLGCAAIFVGTAMTTGVLKSGARPESGLLVSRKS